MCVFVVWIVLLFRGEIRVNNNNDDDTNKGADVLSILCFIL